ncbi:MULTISPECIES: carbamoyltransferase family protein [Bacillaceae]|uniref:carbamoyltransferase family protein n=1 Tax=Bacillaceae TaxID=186817 RepID=UPI000BFE5C95|nr:MULTISPECIES: carbamoyltransferase C-terminal domain-containing protein [Bacillaceae]PGT83466.1 carbamoyltransferase [Bacillus sp. AFS040349]UGB31352.1 hypothetical protein LPC09_02130 [Metabacillus sp. B2-18]UGB33635.1 hypothetical protein LPC09_25605 [Metabacillus sp. B2-18]
MFVLGINYSHDAAACLVEDGKVVAAIQKERLTRRKHDLERTISDERMIQYCLDARGISIDEVDLIVSNVQSLSYGGVGLTTPLQKDFSLFDPFSEKHLFISHHLAHAYSAFSPSGQSESIVMVIDAAGSSSPEGKDYVMAGPEMKKYLLGPTPKGEFKSEAESYYLFTNNSYKLLDRFYLPSHSSEMIYTGGIGMAYAIVSNYIFDDPLESGKVMGLAPYGDCNFHRGVNIMSSNEDKVIFNNNWQLNFNKPGFHEDQKHLAAIMQRDLENALEARIKSIFKKTTTRNICYAGGVALNCVANGKVLSKYANELFIQPAANDAGIAIGCAYYGYSFLKKQNAHYKQTHDYLGKKYTSQEVSNVLSNYLVVNKERTPNDQLINEVAKRLEKGEIVAWFEGGSEFGPRSLGHRSIICNPMLSNMKSKLNERVKHRESFRPFAPVCPVECADSYFEVNRESPFMLLSFDVKSDYRESLPAITHVDNSTRLQTLHEKEHPRLHKLLHKFGELTSIPVLLNTSFNVMGEPIVETPEDAINCFLSTDIDVLVIENWIITKKELDRQSKVNSYPVFRPSITLISEESQGYQLLGISNGKKITPLKHEEFEVARTLLLNNGQKTLNELVDSEFQLEKHLKLCEAFEQLNYLNFTFEKHTITT